MYKLATYQLKLVTSCNLQLDSWLFNMEPQSTPERSLSASQQTNLPSSGAATGFVLRLHGGTGGQQCLDHLQVAFEGCRGQWPVASAGACYAPSHRVIMFQLKHLISAM
jgi:hypothetical protein